ncbi:MAG: uroporphyrinogen-III decarboxylase-like protein [Verrucomicrobia bacterium]|nr:uroporphyrinogen-III decarboxylase-like protein [Verrucomicrobiota bacterium]
MPKETMTPRERWVAVLKREKPDRVPMDFWSTSEVLDRLKAHLGIAGDDELWRGLHIDRPVSVGPRYAGPPIAAGRDMYGIEYRTVVYETGTYSEAVHHPLAACASVDEIEANYTWPTPDWFDYSAVPAQIKGKEHRPAIGGGSEPFLVYKDLRGDVQAFVDLIEHPDIVRYCLDKLYAFAYENTRRIYEAVPGKIVCSYVAEDLGGQEDLMYSPGQIREFFLPWMRKMIALVHDAGAYAFHHSDGAVRKILPDMIDAGIDVLNPVQWRCAGMERTALKRDFGDRLVFHGGVDNQQTLPFGTPDDVRREVLDNLHILGAGGGYILAPCHNIQPITPIENILALYETGYEHGWV